MISCNDCKWADWNRTKNGRLHPDKTGRCTYLNTHPFKTAIPAAFYFLTIPTPVGGHIERNRNLSRDCIFGIRK